MEKKLLFWTVVALQPPARAGRSRFMPTRITGLWEISVVLCRSTATVAEAAIFLRASGT